MRPHANTREAWRRDPFCAPLRTLAVLAAVTALVYLPILRAEFVYEDKPWLTRIDGWPTLGGLLGLGGYPLTSTGLQLAIGLWPGDRTVAVHLLGFLLHLLNGLLLFVVLRRLASDAVALCAAGLFWLHPLHVQAVAYGAAQGELWNTAGLLVAALGLTQPKAWLGVVLTAIGGFMGLAGKASGIVTPLLLLPIALYCGRLRRYLLAAACWIGPLIIAWPVAVGYWHSHYTRAAETTPAIYALRQAGMVARFLGMTWLPVGQSLDHDATKVSALALVGLLAWGALLLAGPRSRSLGVAAVAWVLVAVAPRFVMRIPEYLNEHQWYVPSLGVTTALGFLVAGDDR